MRKLNKNFTGQKMTVEAMANSCLNGCSCSQPKCSCSIQRLGSYTESYNQASYLKATYRNAAY